MNELQNIINLFSDVGLDIYSNIESNYAETDIASVDCIEEFINLNAMIHSDYCMYINYDEDLVIFDRRDCEYLGFWR